MSLLDNPAFSHHPLEDQLGLTSMITWKDEHGSSTAFLGKNNVAEASFDPDEDDKTTIVYMNACFRGADKHYDSWSFKGIPAAKKWVEEYVQAWIAEAGLQYDPPIKVPVGAFSKELYQSAIEMQAECVERYRAMFDQGIITYAEAMKDRLADVPEFTEGLCGDGAAILKDGQPMSISEILAALRKGAELEALR